MLKCFFIYCVCALLLESNDLHCVTYVTAHCVNDNKIELNSSSARISNVSQKNIHINDNKHLALKCKVDQKYVV